jgi:chromosome segregation ATPase
VPALTAPAEDEHRERFAALWDESEHLRLVYEKMDAEYMAEVERLLRTKRCQINRISGLIDRVLAGMHEYLNAAKKYYEVWGSAEEKRMKEQQKVLANMVVDQERVAGILDEEKKNRETLERKEATLEQSKRTEEIRKDIDELKKDILDSEERLNKAQRAFDSLTVQITNMKASFTARLIGIRQNSARLDAYGLDQTSVYEDKRKAAREECNKLSGTGGLPRTASRSDSLVISPDRYCGRPAADSEGALVRVANELWLRVHAGVKHKASDPRHWLPGSVCRVEDRTRTRLA